MSKGRAQRRTAREREAGIKAAAKGAEQERQERQETRDTGSKSGGKSARATGTGGRKPAKKPGARPSAKKSGARPSAKKRGRGRAEGPLARRRRFRIRLLLVVLLVVNLAVGIIWRDWAVSLAVLILSVITAPLLAALLLRRR